MNDTNTDQTINAWLQTIADILLRAFIVGFGFLLLSTGAILLLGDFVLDMQTNLFDISAEQASFITLFLLGAFELSIFAFFLIPYIAIRWTLARRAHQA